MPGIRRAGESQSPVATEKDKDCLLLVGNKTKSAKKELSAFFVELVN